MVLEKIKYFNSRCSNIEWSGVGVMKVEGSLEQDNLSINIIDLILKDVGTAGYTEYDWGTTLAEYFEGNEDKWPVMFFSIHSHHNMGVSPSGVDDKHLYDNIENFPFHLSIIVNNKLDFNARIATDMYITQVEKRGIDSTYKKEKVTNSRLIVEYSVPVSIFKENVSFKEEFDKIEEEKRLREAAKRITISETSNPYAHRPLPFETGYKKPKSNYIQGKLDFDYKDSLTPYKIFTLGFKKGNNIKEILDKLDTEDKIDDHLDAIEKYLIDYAEEGYDVTTPLEKLINLIDTMYDGKHIDSLIHGLNSIGMLLESAMVDEQDEFESWNKPMNSLTEAEFNKLARQGKL